jgi:murein DD-endopeptidase MepM/ murein hydrolase activator NlpD
LAQPSPVGFVIFGFGHRRRHALRRRVRRATAAVTAIAFAGLSVSGFAGGSSPHRAQPNVAAVPRVVQELFHPPHAFPMRANPGYGDGLDAGRGHEGQDLFGPAGTPLVAVSDAVVVETGSNGGAGNYVSIYDPAADRTYNYFHMLGPALVGQGEGVSAGQKLGELGCTGSCWGNHLHFEVRAGRNTWGPVIDPVPVLQRLRAG